MTPARSGLCGWRRPQPGTVELGYCLGRRWSRQDLMSEAVLLLLDKAQREPTVHRARAHCLVDNVGSAAVLERSGLVVEGRTADYAILPNIRAEPRDCLLFGTVIG
jgi:RimJ/RimL family protein N-acetyltransferase